MRKILFQKNILMRSMLGMMACVMFFMFSGFVSEAAEGKVTANTAKIRKEANTDSEVVGSTSKGKTVDIVGAEKDSSGMVWYKVPNGNNTYGYIRSDLVETSDTIEVTQQASSDSSSETANKPDPTVPTSIGEQQATVAQSSVRVRAGASTEHDAVGSLTEGTEITLIGEANDSAGNKWYQIRCDSKNMEGYIRSDLITIGGGEESTEGENEGGETAEGENPEGELAEGEGEEVAPVEPAEPAEPEHNDYEIVYNEDQYWLYNNLDSTMMKVEDLLDVVNTANENNETLQNQIKSNKIIVVILAVIIVILVVAVTILIFKLRDLYYGDYEEEEEEEEEEPVPVRKKQKRPVEEEEPAPVKKKRPAAESIEQKERPAKAKPAQSELQAAEKRQPEKKSTPRKAQNFLLDDDEFEFEFLNMDDKDL